MLSLHKTPASPVLFCLDRTANDSLLFFQTRLSFNELLSDGSSQSFISGMANNCFCSFFFSFSFAKYFLVSFSFYDTFY